MSSALSARSLVRDVLVPYVLLGPFLLACLVAVPVLFVVMRVRRLLAPPPPPPPL